MQRVQERNLVLCRCLLLLVLQSKISRSYCFKLDTKIVNIRQPMRPIANDAEKAVGVLLWRVRMVTDLPSIRMQSSSNAQIAPSSRSLPTKPPTREPDSIQNLFQQLCQRQMVTMLTQMMAPAMSPASESPTTNLWPVTGAPPAPAPLKRPAEGPADNGIANKINKSQEGDVTANRTKENDPPQTL
jgi:hypothetical protein